MFEARSASFESWRFVFLSYICLLDLSKRLNCLLTQIAITDIFEHVTQAVTLIKTFPLENPVKCANDHQNQYVFPCGGRCYLWLALYSYLIPNFLASISLLTAYASAVSFVIAPCFTRRNKLLSMEIMSSVSAEYTIPSI